MNTDPGAQMNVLVIGDDFVGIACLVLAWMGKSNLERRKTESILRAFRCPLFHDVRIYAYLFSSHFVAGRLTRFMNMKGTEESNIHEKSRRLEKL